MPQFLVCVIPCARARQVVKKTRSTLVNRTVPAAAVAEWRGRIEDMAEDVERLVLVCTWVSFFTRIPMAKSSFCELSRSLLCSWGWGKGCVMKVCWVPCCPASIRHARHQGCAVTPTVHAA